MSVFVTVTKWRYYHAKEFPTVLLLGHNEVSVVNQKDLKGDVVFARLRPVVLRITQEFDQ